jgi:LemA protein
MDSKILVLCVIVALLLGALVAGLIAMMTYNGFVAADQSVNAQWANVEGAYQRRFDLIPRLVNLTKMYTNYEGSLLQNITALRSQWGAATTPEEKQQVGGALDSAIGRLIMVTENYPELKSNEQYLKTMDELAGTENRINVERVRYNEEAKNFNVMIKRFPDSMVANWGGFKEKAYYEAQTGAENAPPIPV